MLGRHDAPLDGGRERGSEKVPLATDVVRLPSRSARMPLLRAAFVELLAAPLQIHTGDVETAHGAAEVLTDDPTLGPQDLQRLQTHERRMSYLRPVFGAEFVFGDLLEVRPDADCAEVPVLRGRRELAQHTVRPHHVVRLRRDFPQFSLFHQKNPPNALCHYPTFGQGLGTPEQGCGYLSRVYTENPCTLLPTRGMRRGHECWRGKGAVLALFILLIDILGTHSMMLESFFHLWTTGGCRSARNEEFE